MAHLHRIEVGRVFEKGTGPGRTAYRFKLTPLLRGIGDLVTPMTLQQR